MHLAQDPRGWLGLSFTALLAWFSGTWLHLTGTDLWVFRIGVFVLFGAIGFLLWQRLSSRSRVATAGRAGADSTEGTRSSGDVGALFREAESKLGRRIADGPVILLVGPPGAGKTSVVLRSGIGARLLAGRSEAGQRSGSETRFASLFQVDRTVLIEVSNSAFSGAESWQQLIKRLAPGKLRSIFGRYSQLSRSVVLCVDSSEFWEFGDQVRIDQLVENVQIRLSEASKGLGVDLPVYVIFTKLDLLKFGTETLGSKSDKVFFLDYAAHLSAEDVTRPLGVTLPILTGSDETGWDDWQTGRMKDGFAAASRQLAQSRFDLLALEPELERRKGAYQFPRNFHKFPEFNHLFKFLLEVGRPFQLTNAPFLRGFYFSGSRVVKNSTIANPQHTEENAEHIDLTATIIQRGQRRTPVLPLRQNIRTENSEWLFLKKLFLEVIFRDRVALTTMQSNSRVNFGRRIALSSVICALVLFISAISISFARNRSMEQQIVSTEKALRGAALSSADSFVRLDQLRQSLLQLRLYRRKGAPFKMRWGLYVGDQVYEDLRKAYFSRFRILLLDPTQTALRASLASPALEFSETYEALKAYLITTSRPEQSTTAFLSPALLKWWDKVSPVREGERDVVRQQLDFYTEEQKTDPPFGITGEDDAVHTARSYLIGLSNADRLYEMAIGIASKRSAPFNFNRQIPGSSEVVVATYEIPGAYTKAGWAAVHSYLKGSGGMQLDTEDWVVSIPENARAAFLRDLPGKYEQQYADHWSKFLASAKITACFAQNSSRHLKLLSGNDSPLLQLFCEISSNTSVDSIGVNSFFEPIRKIAPVNEGGKCVNDVTRNYTDALFDLSQTVQEFHQNASEPAARTQVDSKLSTARNAAHSLESQFHLDAAISKLLDDPIEHSATCTASGTDFGGVCTEFQKLKSKYPFNLRGTDISLKEFDSFWGPQGSLWSFVDQELKGSVSHRGHEVTSVGKPVKKDFLSFLNRAAGITDALYRDGQSQAHMKFSLGSYPVEGVTSVTLSLGGKQIVFSGEKQQAVEVIWPEKQDDAGQRINADLLVELIGGVQAHRLFPGEWGLFRLLASMSWTQRSAGYDLEWVIRERDGADPLSYKGKPVTLRFSISGGGPANAFSPGYFSALDCPGKIFQ